MEIFFSETEVFRLDQVGKLRNFRRGSGRSQLRGQCLVTRQFFKNRKEFEHRAVGGNVVGINTRFKIAR